MISLRNPIRLTRRASMLGQAMPVTDVKKIAEMSDGTYWSDTQDVVVTLAACLEDLQP